MKMFETLKTNGKSFKISPVNVKHLVRFQWFPAFVYIGRHKGKLLFFSYNCF